MIVAAIAGLFSCGGVYFWGPSKTPPAQKPLLTLSTTNFSEFEASFDQAADGSRLVLLLSPT